MPGFGLQGPWRDYVGWAFNFEQTSGMAAVTGYPDGPPCVLQGPADPIVGVHAGVALLAALEHRRRTGEGQLIEIAQIEVAASVVAEPVIEYSMNGVVAPREGNRQRGYLQGVYPTAVDGEWVAISIRDDVGLDHDAFDEAVAAWTRTLQPSEVVDILTAQGIPAEQVLTADRMYDLAQLDARGFYQELEHPITGVHRYPGWPFRITPGPVGHHRFPPPTLGQHNDEVLRGLGLTDERDRRPARAKGDRREGAQRVATSTSDQYLCLPLGQLVRRDRTERGRVAGEPDRRVGQGIGPLEPETARCERTEQQGAPQVRPVLQVRLDSGGPRESQRRQVHSGLLRHPAPCAVGLDRRP